MTYSQKYIFLLKTSFYILLLSLSVLSLDSCRKYSDPAPIEDNRLDSNKYCNNPDAVNYNWGFPGQPSEDICIFPSDVFAGAYTLIDSAFTSSDTFIQESIYTNTQMIPLAHNYVSLTNYCSDSLTILLSTYLEVFSDTADDNVYTICGADTFTLSGIHPGIDSTDFAITKSYKNSALGYSKLYFIQQ